ncbi:hypothetical protein [Streptomyces decoyicus]|uniref:hypothetical protein n=1 Tax=Streptomyces decoyicus TaxID=249567 RepID=UPI00339EA580
MVDRNENVHVMEGYVYVVGFQSGLVKVGMSGKPKIRLSKYVKDGIIHGNPVTQTWLSPPHMQHVANESRLIKYCASRGLLATGRERGEYFTGLDFDTVRAFAQSLEFPRFSPEEQERWEEANQDATENWRSHFRLDVRRYTLPAEVTELDEVSDTEGASLMAGWAAAVGVSIEDLNAVHPQFAEQLTGFMLKAANLKRDAEYFRMLAEQIQVAFEEHSTEAWAALAAEIRQAVQCK